MRPQNNPTRTARDVLYPLLEGYVKAHERCPTLTELSEHTHMDAALVKLHLGELRRAGWVRWQAAENTFSPEVRLYALAEGEMPDTKREQKKPNYFNPISSTDARRITQSARRRAGRPAEVPWPSDAELLARYHELCRQRKPAYATLAQELGCNRVTVGKKLQQVREALQVCGLCGGSGYRGGGYKGTPCECAAEIAD